MRFSEYIDLALYDPTEGFYSSGGQAGRRGDFITSAEVGPLFGACLANYLDARWLDLGEPSSFVVAEVGAGPGTLARSILAAEPQCGSALVYVAVEQSELQRRSHPDGVTSVASLSDAADAPAVVLANELLDNLAFDVYERHDGLWHEVRVGGGEVLCEVRIAAPDVDLPAAPDGVRLPLCRLASEWVAAAIAQATSRVLTIDYCTPVAEMIATDESRWIRTYRQNSTGTDPLDAPGTQDITTEVPLEQITAVTADGRPPVVQSQADFLGTCAIADLVEQGRAVWAERAHIGDLAALKARSRVTESEALLDPAGLGGFTVVEWRLEQK